MLLGGLTIGWAVGAADRAWHFGHEASVHSGPTIEQVQALSCLVTTRVSVADVLETHLDGYTGGVKAAMLVKGDFLLGVDLSRARFESVDDKARTAVIVLPQPQVTSPRLDHEHTKVFAVLQSGLWQMTPGGGQTSGEVIDRGYRDAQRFVATACDDPTWMSRSRQQAEHVLAAFFEATGWSIKIRWDSTETLGK
jgi:hypothetical protein